MADTIDSTLEKMYIETIFKRANDTCKNLKIEDEIKSFEYLYNEITHQSENFQRIAKETAMKNIPCLIQATISYFDVGVIVGLIMQKYNLTPQLLKMARENQELKQELDDLQKLLPSLKEDLSYIK